MAATEKGSFCFSCKKEVIDFTEMSDMQLARFLKRRLQTFGRFLPEQLNHALPLPKKEMSRAKYFFIVAIPAFLLAARSNAQLGKDDHASVTVTNSIIRPFSTAGLRTIKGMVQDERGNPVEAVSVLITGTPNGTVTDKEGRFKLRLLRSADSISVIALNYTPYTMKIPLHGSMICILEKKDEILEGVTVNSSNLGLIRRSAMMGGARISSIRITKTVEHKEVVKDFLVFPNPVHAKELLYFKWSKPLAGNLLITIFSANGDIIQRENRLSDMKLSSSSVLLKEMPKGMYILMVENNDTKEKLSKEFIVI